MTALDWVYVAWAFVILQTAGFAWAYVHIERQWRALLAEWETAMDEAYAEGADDALAGEFRGRHHAGWTHDATAPIGAEWTPELPPDIEAIARAVKDVWDAPGPPTLTGEIVPHVDGWSQPSDWVGAVLPRQPAPAPVPILDGDPTEQLDAVILTLRRGFARARRQVWQIGAGNDDSGGPGAA